MSNVALVRDHKGDVLIKVGEQIAFGAEFIDMGAWGDGRVRVKFAVPIEHVTFEESTNVIPFPVARANGNTRKR